MSAPPGRLTPAESAAAIRASLRRRSGRAWSVRVGRGSVFGWLYISAPASRLLPGKEMTGDDRACLRRLLGVDNVHSQGVIVEQAPSIRAEWVARAEGVHADQARPSGALPIPGGLRPGERVIARYRLPSPLQPWLRTFCFGTVAEPGADPAVWCGTGSEQAYCETAGGLVVVDYPHSRQYERASDLVRVTAEEEAMDHAARVARFLGPAARRTLECAQGAPRVLDPLGRAVAGRRGVGRERSGSSCSSPPFVDEQR